MLVFSKLMKNSISLVFYKTKLILYENVLYE